MRDTGDPDEGWAGAHSLPYLLTRDADHVNLSLHPDALRKMTPIDSTGAITGASYLEWTHFASETLSFSGPGKRWSIRAKDGVLHVTADEIAQTMPLGDSPVVIVIDGPILEILHDGAILGGPIPKTDHVDFRSIGGGA